MKELEVVAFGEVDLALAPLYVLEPDLVLEVDARNERRGDPNLTEASVEQLFPLGQRQVDALL